MEEVREVKRGQVMEGLLGEEEFELDALLNRELVELFEDGGDVLLRGSCG